MCAITIQKAAGELNIPIRAGIHQGEVIFEKNDVLGDGVNIASRILGRAESQEIVVTERVYDDIKNKEGLEIEFLGNQDLKGVSKPVGIYKISDRGDGLPDLVIDTGELTRPFTFGRTTIIVGIIVIAIIAFAVYYFIPKYRHTSSEPGKSVLILPFNNYLGTDTLDYFVAGMHNELISDIQKVSALHVKSRTTANAYKNTNKSIPEIADELGVNTFIEGAVTCIGDSVCLQVKLLDQEENELWIQDFRAERSQILRLYNNVTKDIADRINITLSPLEQELLTDTRSVDHEAYDLYMKGQFYLERINMESLINAEDCFNKAIEIDPDWAPLHAGRAMVGISQMQMGFVAPSVAIPKIYTNFNKALELDPNSALSHTVKGVIAVWTEWNWEKGEKEVKRALELNPNDALSRIMYAHLLYILRRYDEALYQANIALELDPERPFILGMYASVLFEVGDYYTAIKHCKKALSIDPENHFANYALEDLYYVVGDYHNSFEMLIREPFIDENIRSVMETAFKEQGYSAAFDIYIDAKEEIAKAGFMPPCLMAMDYAKINKHDKALDWLEKGIEIHDPMMPYIGCGDFRPYIPKDNPRYVALLKKMNLPLD
jgi:TolB-like protein/Tfp pilus assembly protein PilF